MGIAGGTEGEEGVGGGTEEEAGGVAIPAGNGVSAAVWPAV